MTQEPPIVELLDVYKTYRRVERPEGAREFITGLLRPRVRETHALAGINLIIARGEMVAYAGPNGAGKSTTVKLLSGLLAPTRGTVRALGLDPSRNRTRYVGRIGVVFGQRTELWWDQPVSATFEWKRVVWDIPDDRYRVMIARMKDLLGLEEFYHSLARELSLGQKMRADLGLALLHEPEILFLDEPTIGLDVLARRHIMRFIEQLNLERQVTVMLTSHDMNELEQLAGRLVLVDKGKIAFDGDFGRLRREFGDRRRLLLRTAGDTAPTVQGATLTASEAGRHEYAFDAAQSDIAGIVRAAAAQVNVIDIEVHRAPIDEVIADIYEKWQTQGEGPGDNSETGADSPED